MTADPRSLPPWPERQPWRLGLGLVEVSVLLTLGGTLLGFFGQWHWVIDLLAHFRGQYLVALTVAGLLFLGARRWRWVAGALGGALVNALAMGLFLPAPTGAAPLRPAPGEAVAPPLLRVATYNVLYQNKPTASALEWLRSLGAEVVFLCEVTPAWSTALRSLSDVYPHQHHSPQSDPFGCAVLSRRPWTQLEEKRFGPFASPSLVVQFRWHDREVLFVGMHPTPPSGRNGSAFRDTALAEVAGFLAAHPVRSQILVGDLNATPWCHPFRSLIKRTNLTDTARGYGWQPTWNVSSLLFQIPIDHVLVSPDFVAADRRIGPDLSSDHRAVIADLRITP